MSILCASQLMGSPVDEVHDFHVSRLTANYIPDEGRLACTLITFVDDIEAALTAHHQLMVQGGTTLIPSKESLNLTEEDEHATIDSLLLEYLNHNLHIRSEASELPLEITYVGKERDDDPYGLFIYFYVEVFEGEKSLDVGLSPKLALQSSFMLDLYEDQQNVVVWKINGESADYDLLTNDKRTCDFER